MSDKDTFESPPTGLVSALSKLFGQGPKEKSLFEASSPSTPHHAVPDPSPVSGGGFANTGSSPRREPLPLEISGIKRHSFKPAYLAAPAMTIAVGDAIACNFAITVDMGDRLRRDIESRPNGKEAFDQAIANELGREFGAAWEIMLTVYLGSVHINVTSFNKGDSGDYGGGPGNGGPQPSGSGEPNPSFFSRVWRAIQRGISNFVSFAKEIWPHVVATVTTITKAAAKILSVKHSLDDIAKVLGFPSAIEAAKRVVRWLFGLGGFGFGLGYA